MEKEEEEDGSGEKEARRDEETVKEKKGAKKNRGGGEEVTVGGVGRGGTHAWGYVLDITSCRKWFPGSADVPLAFFSLSLASGAAAFECQGFPFLFFQFA